MFTRVPTIDFINRYKLPFAAVSETVFLQELHHMKVRLTNSMLFA